VFNVNDERGCSERDRQREREREKERGKERKKGKITVINPNCTGFYYHTFVSLKEIIMEGEERSRKGERRAGK
jgi:hypothetical protein